MPRSKRRTPLFFDQRPRTLPEQLFGREEEVEKLFRALEAGSWVAVLGPRMVGKTSLALAGANEFARKKDYNVVLVDLRDTETFREATEKILSRLPRSVLNSISEYISRISEVSATKGGLGLTVKLKKSAPARRALSDALFRVRDTILILDEVQGIQQGVPHFLKALGAVFNENPSLQIIFTGSYSGVVRRLFEATYSDESYGRPPISIMLSPWKEPVAEDFLRTGFEKLGVPYEEWEIRDAIRNLGTLPGWLNLYGVKRYVERNHERALKMAVRDAVKEAKSELENILRGRSPKAREVVRLLAFGASWSDLIKTGISEDALSRLLGILTEELFILSKDEMGIYYFADPVYRKAAMNISLVVGSE
uniref:ATP-binding protein n=2 Tax=Thermococcus aciditolerans TaxID=2598455 RepID=A0A5C0SPP7_9EURY|nr:ATP-binding protein [Thermococcus aciditolerans]